MDSTGFVIDSPQFFDYCETQSNIRPVRVTPYKVYDYTIKDGDIVDEEGTPPSPPGKESAKDNSHEIMEATTRDKFFKRAAVKNLRDTVLHFKALDSFADWKYRDVPEEYKPCEMICFCERYPQLSD